ncbi:MAG: non-canonical purine NTP diphosphatase [Prevotellaceae bacterium]|jgi:non-canonical purine NTP pyrophosphatase, rdgB/HAM1 family|nr:non-canonical purine NTP diphosphatase [Prevotellaceae bacterium]
MKQRLVIATNNAHKLEEITAVVGDKFEIVSLADIDCHEDIPETADTLEGNALLKARFVHERYGLDVFADDTGLEVDALGGQPGVHTARYAYPDRNDNEANVDKLLRELQDATNRKAHFRTVIALIIGGEEYLFEGRVDGHITETRRGTEGFGYDPVFSPEDTGKTFAELGVEVKNRLSHRARAVQKLCAFLEQLDPH